MQTILQHEFPPIWEKAFQIPSVEEDNIIIEPLYNVLLCQMGMNNGTSEKIMFVVFRKQDISNHIQCIY